MAAGRFIARISGLSAGKALPACIVAVLLLSGACGDSSRPAERTSKNDPPISADDQQPRNQLVTETGQQLYSRHCAACHGDRGDGNGIAAAFLFPKPRDFRTGRFRLVSTTNGVPTHEDLEAVLVRGMPGSAMLPWDHLSTNDRKLLAQEVMRFRRDGAREQYVAILRDEEELTDEELQADDVQQEIDEFVHRRTTAGPGSEVPTIGSPDHAAIARGKEIYLKQSCHACHGADGKGDGGKEQFDDEGFPTRPRDFTLGIFKGGHDPASVYRRIAYGMPGTPMPASTNLTPQQNVDLVHFIRSLSDEESRDAAVFKRLQITARKANRIPNTPDAAEWDAVPSVRVTMMPLWWRDDADPDLRVQTVHDQTTLAVRLSWRDLTADRHAGKSEAFEDAVALELYRGRQEPFVGMGAMNSPVEVWFWDADRQGPPTDVEDVYPNTVVDIYPFNEQLVTTAAYDRPGTKTAAQPDVSVPARASANPIMPSEDKLGGSTLAVGGPGTVTFRLPRSQLVNAHGEWNDGRWAVVITRRLQVDSASDGVLLEPGSRVSIAFAVWDGSRRDRDGQKLITIWHDLELE